MPAHLLARPFASLRFLSLSRPAARLLATASLARSRRTLRQLDDHLLRDIGLTRHEAAIEAERPVWDPPAHWKG